MDNHPSRIYLLSHMRAFSSLIGHILGSHPQINGYYEMHISYQNNTDLNQQEKLYKEQESIKTGSHFLFDKLLHNAYELDLQQLDIQPPKILIALRSPQKTIKSIINLFQQKDEWHRYSEPVEAVNYYIQRLQKLSEFSLQNSKQYYYFDTELIQTNTTELLSSLTHWIELASPLNDQYQLFSQTGKSRAGDSSDMIQSGKILSSTTQYSEIDIPIEFIEKAEQVYEKFRKIIIEHCIEGKLLS